MIDPAEVKAAFDALRSEIGPKARVSVSINTYSAWTVACAIYPYGVGGNGPIETVRVEANSWSDLYEKAVASWEVVRGTYSAERMRQMALQIISTTMDLGECSDAALRGAGFEHSEIALYGADACALADEMAGKGPFSIRETAGSNAAKAA